MKKVAIITGALGGIGQALCEVFAENGYSVVGIDRVAEEDIPHCEFSHNYDLHLFGTDEAYRKEVLKTLDAYKDTLYVLINNAAVQLLDHTPDLKLNDWTETMAVNLTAPMLLSQWALDPLSANKGSVVNISSIHQLLTKRKFVSYATSKSALVGLTKAMAVDLQGSVRVNCISPAAIETDMLKAGFDNDKEALGKLHALHPTQRIGYPKEVAQLALFLTSKESGFINGANLQLDGGISSVLHDL